MNKNTRRAKPRRTVSSAALTATKRIQGNGNGSKSRQYEQAEKALRESEEKFRNLFKYAKDAIILADTQTGLITDVNTAGCRLLGLPKKKIIGMHQSAIHPPELAEKYKKVFKGHVEKGIVNDEYMIIQRADGKQIPVDISTSLITTGDRTIIQGIFRDVSERLKMERALKESEEKITKAFRSIPEAVSIATLKDGVFLEVNDSFISLNGYSRDEIIGHTGKELDIWVNPEDRYRMKQLISKKGHFENEEFLLRRKNGETRTVLLSADIITYEDKKCLLTIGTDITERKRMEEALRQSEAKYSSLVERSNDGIIIIENGVLKFINSKMAEMTGYTIEEAVGRNFIDFAAPEERKKLVEIHMKRMKGVDVPTKYEAVIIARDGQRIHTEISAVLITYEGRPAVMAIVRDVTERKQVEQVLIDEATRRKILVDQSRDGIVVLETDGKVYEANQKFAEMLGYTHDEVMKLHVFDWEFLYPPEKVVDMIKTVDEKGDHFETQHRRKDGTTYDVEISTNGAMFAGQKLIFCVCRDITERKKMEQTLIDESTRRRILIEQSSDGIVILDEDGKVYDANQKFADMLGYTLEEVRKLDVFDWSPPTPREPILESLRAVDEKGDHFETQHQRKDGTTYDVEISTNGAVYAGQKLVFCVCRDITERKRMEQAIRESEEKFSKAFHTSPHQIIITRDGDDITLEVNDTFTKVTGFTREETIGKTSQELGVWPESEDMLRLQQTLKEHGRIDNEEFEFLTKSGDKMINLLSIEPITIGGEKCWISVSTDITRLKQIEKALRESEENISRAFQAIPEAVSITVRKNAKLIKVNDSFTTLTGYTREEAIGKTAEELDIWVNLKDHKLVKELTGKQRRFENEELLLKRKSGEPRNVLVSAESIDFGGESCIMVVCHDITERKRQENLQKAENHVLMLLSESAELNEILDAIVRLCEQNDSSIKGSVMLYDASTNLLTGFGPSLSEEYNAAMKMGIPTGPVAGSCGTAAHRKKRVIIRNIKTSSLFKPFKEGVELATRNGFRAVWSEPIISSSGDLLGTIANYSNHTGGPNAENIEVLEWSARIAAIAIERKRIEQALRESEEKFSKAFHGMPEGVAIARMKDGVFIDVNESFCRDNNYTREEVIGHRGEELDLGITPSQRDKVIKTLKKHGHVKNMEIEFSKKTGDITALLLSAETINLGGEPYLLTITSNITKRKKMEQALRESEERITKAFQAIPEAISVASLEDDVFLEVNDSFISFSGYTREEIIGHTTKEIVHWVNPDDVFRMKQLKDKRTHFKNEEFLLRNKSGETITLLMSGDVINFGGKPCILTVGTDITERKQIEQALKESEEKFSKAFHTIPEAISISRLKDGVFIDVNESFCRTNEYTREEVIGHTGKELITWVDPNQREEFFRLVREKGHVKNIECEFRKKSGEIHTALMSADIVNIGGQTCVLSVTGDITERKQMEQAIKESEEKFSKAFHALPETLSISTLKEGRFVDVNESFLKLNQLTREDVIGRTGEEMGFLKPGDERNRIRELLKKRKKFNNEEIEFKPPKSDNQLTFLFSADTIEIAGEPCLLIIGNDITKRKQAEKNLQQALVDLEQNSALLKATNKELESFSYSVSHDLRSPLRSIDGFSQALLEDYKDTLDENGQDYLNRLRSASQKMGELIDGLLKLSRLTRSEMHYESVDLSSLANEIATRLRETHDKRDVQFIIDDNLKTTGDPQMLRVLLENLLGNAWKFTENTTKARIEFGSTTENGTKTFFIKDNGAGFDMAFKDKLFGAFQRLHDAVEYPGTGIGLATVQRIINRHGGNIRAEGATGKGASFYFTLN